MNDNDLTEFKAKMKPILQTKFIQGDCQYRMTKNKTETKIYDNNIEICQYDHNHTNFLHFLNSISDEKQKFEQKFQDYYKYANSPEYDLLCAEGKLKELNDFIRTKHPFFRHSKTSLLYIRLTFFEYFCKTAEYRYLIYTEQFASSPLPDFQEYRDEVLTPKELKEYHEQLDHWTDLLYQQFHDFQISDQKFMEKLFSPIYKLIYDKYDDFNIQKSLGDLWIYYLYYSHVYTPVSNDRTKDKTFVQYFLFEDNRKKTKTRYALGQIPMLSRLNIILDVFKDYFSVFSEMLDTYSGSRIFHQYGLILTNNHHFYHLIESCTFYSPHQSMHKLLLEHIESIYSQEHSGTLLKLLDRVAQDMTDDLYCNIKDSFDSDANTREKISEMLQKYYPFSLEQKTGDELIEFQFFEQLLAFELLDIISQNRIIRQCPICKKHFIAHAKNHKYCPEHRNKPHLQQRTYMTKKKAEQSPIESIFLQWKEALTKRKERKKISDDIFFDIIRKSAEIKDECISNNTTPSEFKAKLDSLCKEYNIKPYHKNKLSK